MSETTIDKPIDEDVLTTHEYDGIREFDNPMPGWWTWIFVATVVWSGVYVVGLQLAFIPDVEDDLRAEVAVQQKLAAAVQAAAPPVTPEMLAGVVTDGSNIKKGESVFKMQCAACHGDKGQGLIGPNLTDRVWIHGYEPTDVYRVVDEGVPANGMPAWGSILPRSEVLAVVAFVESLRGTNVAGGKEPQGEIMEGAGEGAAPEAAGTEPSAPSAGPDAGTDPEGAESDG